MGNPYFSERERGPRPRISAGRQMRGDARGGGRAVPERRVHAPEMDASRQPRVAQACHRVGTDAWVWRPRSWRASRTAPGPRLLGLGAVAVDRACPPRPGAGKRRTG